MNKIFTIIALIITTSIFSQVVLDSQLREYYNGTNWENESKTEYQYDADNNLVESVWIVWDNSSATWINGSKFTNTYNANDQLTEQIYLGWNGSSNQWEKQYKYTNAYNADNDIIQQKGFVWNTTTNQWDVESKIDVNYYMIGKLEQAFIYYWDGSQWVNEDKITATYDANDLLDFYIEEEWNGSSWDKDYKIVYTHNANEKIIETIDYEWDGGQWVDRFKTIFNVDANSNRIFEIDYDYQGGSWEESWKTEYAYDTAQLMASIAHPFGEPFEFLFEDFPYYHKVLGTNELSHDGTQWNDDSRTTFHYDNSAGITDSKLAILNIFPNPTTEQITISINNDNSISEVILFDNMGKQILERTTNTINLKPLQTGVYIIKITDTNGNTYSEQIIKE